MSLTSIIDKTISHLSVATFNEIINVFNITVDNPNDKFETLQEKFRTKLIDIFQSQGRNYVDYFRLPKFHALQQSTRQKLYILLNEIWNQYFQKMDLQKKQYRNENLQKLIPDFKDTQEIQTFHLELFKSFRSSKYCKQNQLDYNSISYPTGPTGVQPVSLQRPRPPIFMTDLQSKYMNLSTNNGNIVYPKIEEDPKFINPMWNDEKFGSYPSNFPIPRMPSHHNGVFPQNTGQIFGNVQKYNSLQKPSKSNQIENQSYNSSQNGNYEQNKSYLTGSENQFVSKVHQFMFSECACQGTNKDTQAFMICKQCQYYYHFQCLHLKSSSNADICPCCKLKQGNTFFVKVHPEAYSKRWCRNLKSQKLSILLTEKQIQKMRKEKKNIKPDSQVEYQLRFLKIISKSQNINEKKVHTDDHKFNSLPLPTNYIEKVQPYNVFQISVKSSDDMNEPEQCTYFFAIFMVQKLSENALIQEIFSNLNEQNSVGEEFMQRFRGGQQSVTIKMRDPLSQNKISYPARGNKCEHAEVFDYMEIQTFYKLHDQRSKVKYCSVCDIPYDKIIVDRFILEKVKEFYQENPEKEIESLKYSGNGHVEYTTVQKQDSYNEEDNSSLAGSESESLSS